MLPITVSFAGQGDSECWDDYVNTHPDGCVFQTYAWRRAVESTYGLRPYYLMAKRGEKVCGVLPLFLVGGRLFGRVLATCPYASSGSVLSDGAVEARSLVEPAIDLARRLNVDYLELKSRSITECEGLERHTDYLNYDLPLGDPETVWKSRLKKETRTSVRRSEKSGLVLEQGHHLLDAFYEMMTLNMRRLGTPVHSKEFYQNLLRCFGQQADIWAVTHQGLPISAVLFLRYRQEIAGLARCSRDEYFHLRPNSFLYWEMFRQACHAGVGRYDFGRSLKGSGAAKFKETWGAEAKPLYYEYFLNKRNRIPGAQLENPRYQLVSAVWRRLPLSFTRLLGPHLIKDIP